MARPASAPVTYTAEDIAIIAAKSPLELSALDRQRLAKYQRDQASSVNQPVEDAFTAMHNQAIRNRLAVREFILAEAALADSRAALESVVVSQGLTKTLKASKTPGKGRQEDLVVPAIPVRRTSFADAMGIQEQILEDSENPGTVLPSLVGRQLAISVFEPCIAAQAPASTIALLVRAGVLAPEKTEGAERSSGKYVVTGVLVSREDMEKLVERQTKEEATASETGAAAEAGGESAPVVAEAPKKGGRGSKRTSA